MRKIEKEIRHLTDIAVKCGLHSQDAMIVLDYCFYGEYEIAIDHLLNQIIDFNIHIDIFFYEKINEMKFVIPSIDNRIDLLRKQIR